MVLVSVGLAAAALVFGGSLAANAVTAPTVSLNVSTATAYGDLEVTADGFPPNEALKFAVDSTDPTSATADAQGHLVETVYVPEGSATGAHKVNVSGTTTPEQSAAFTVVASPTASLGASTVTFSQFNGTGTTATVTGFTAGDKVQFGYGTGGSGGAFGDPVTVGADGVATISVTSQAVFGSATVEPRIIYISANNATDNIRSGQVTLTIVANPAATPAPAPAAPAVPVKGSVSFTG